MRSFWFILGASSATALAIQRQPDDVPLYHHFGFDTSDDVSPYDKLNNRQLFDCPTVLIPERKLAFCRIPKVASAEFTKLFNGLNGVHEAEGISVEEFFNYSSSMYMGIDKSTITKANQWKFAFFVREPIERYISAFLSKCVPDASTGEIEGGGKHCCGDALEELGPNPKQAIIEAFEKRAQRDIDKGHDVCDNPHWLKQSTVLKECGPHFNKTSSDFIGTLSGDMHTQVTSMLELVYQPHPGLQDVGALAKQFPTNGGILGHVTADTITKDELLAGVNPSIISQLRGFFEKDYNIYCHVKGCDWLDSSI
jgi:hypothetical protein